MVKQKKGETKIFFLMLVSLLFVVVWSAGLVSADGIDEYTKLMLHLDGTDGSTTDADFIDSSASEHTVSQEGNAKLENTEKKFGVTSGYFDGTGDYLTLADSEDWDLGTDNFTIDFWAYASAWTVGDGFFEIWDDSNNFILARISGTQITLQMYNGGEKINKDFTSANLPTNTWVHIAFVKDGSELTLYLDGVDTGSVTNSDTWPDLAGNLHIAYNQKYGKYYEGYLDEFRISKGVVRWTSNFTPDTSPYSEGFGNLTTYWVTPVTDTNVQQNEFFKVQIGVNCTGGDCGDVNVTLDPEEVKKAIEDYKAQQNIITGEVVEEVENEMNFFEMILDFIKGVFGG